VNALGNRSGCRGPIPSPTRPIDKGVRVRELPGAAFYGVLRSHHNVTCQQCGATRKWDMTSITDINRDDLDEAIRLKEYAANSNASATRTCFGSTSWRWVSNLTRSVGA
jgi:hypothetical protein